MPFSTSRRRAPSAPLRAARHQRAGFTIVEAIVALLLMAVGLLAVAASGAVVVREVGAVAARTRGGLLARNRVEIFAASTCTGAGIAGTDSLRAARGHWSVRGDGALRTLSDSIVMLATNGVRTVGVTSARAC
jgi:Tfp pilus assembly protein PilV